MATILETHKISPCSAFSLPLVFFDMVWYDFAANNSLLFFDFPCSKPHFFDTILPRLQKSLSLTLSHFLPLAGNLIHPLNPADKPLLLYELGNTVSFTVAESGADFAHLTGNHPRNCDDFYPLSPVLPPAAHSETSVSCPVLALQVTLFPGQGLSIGFVSHHAVADASTVVSFIRAWAMINKMESDADHNICAKLAENNLLPFYNRETVTNLNGLDSLYWDEILKSSCSAEPPPVQLPIDKLRATFVLKRDQIEKLKNLVRAKCVGVADHVSSFTVICALVWESTARSATEGAVDMADEELEYFCFVGDCRGRLKPPLPANYFGNCVALLKAELKHGEAKGANGFVTAAKAIGAAVSSHMNREKGVVDGAENWPEEYGNLVGKRLYGVAGSPRFDFYAADFGWGKPKKFEALFIDGGGSVSLCKSRDFEGGLEIGMSKTKVEMDAFAKAFNQLLLDLLH